MSQDHLLLSNGATLATENTSRATYEEHVQHVSPLPVGRTPLPLVSYLATNAPSIEMAADGSVTALTFELAPGANEIHRVDRLVLVMDCAAAPTLDSTHLGDQAALAAGLLLELRNASGVLVDLLGGEPIQSNADLAALFEVALSGNLLVASWRPAAPLRLEGSDSEVLRCTVQDNLSALTRLRLLAEGKQEASLT